MQRVRAGVPVHIILKRLIAPVLENDTGITGIRAQLGSSGLNASLSPIRKWFQAASASTSCALSVSGADAGNAKSAQALKEKRWTPGLASVFRNPEPGHRGGEIHEAPRGLHEHLAVIPIDIAAGRPDVTWDFGSWHHGAERRGHQRNARRAVRTVDRGTLAAASIKPHAPAVFLIGVFREFMELSMLVTDEFKRFRPDLVSRPGLSK